MRLLKEPLLHFVFIGLILFASYAALNPDSDNSNEREIFVDREGLLNHIRQQNRTTSTESLEGVVENMSPKQLRALIDAYVKDEALFREAKALGLDRHDPVARQRLIRNLEYITTSFVVADGEVSDDAVQKYYEETKNDYRRPAEVSFTHVFFSHEKRDKKDSGSRAEETLQLLNSEQASIQKGLEYGDRFLYHATYFNRNADEVAAHFGPAMQRRLFELDVDKHTWQGPITSTYGEHLVMLVNKSSEYLPALPEIREEIVKDIQQTRLETESGKAIQSVINGYEVTVAEGLLQK